ncbi:hypothetical protein BKA62DRAFT_775057 [Auriculariales sp. MPI-PUGE-AT-0066]|nr:hypothetical protein BKA62DRAFT_775057 [Auriculariales sp. MPI-PUGE-AT-0066]
MSGHEGWYIGPLLMGSLVQVGIFGIILSQTTIYFAKQGRAFTDGISLRIYVGVVVLLAAALVCISVWRLWSAAVMLKSWTSLPYTFLEPIFIVALVTLVQGFFILSREILFVLRGKHLEMCLQLSRSGIILAVLVLVMCSQVICSIVIVVYDSQKNWRGVQKSAVALSSTTMILDIVMSTTLFYNLFHQRTGGIDADALILRVIALTVQSFLPCLFCVILIFIGALNFGGPAGILFRFATPWMSPLYANALLTTLNARSVLRRQFDGERRGGRLYLQSNTSRLSGQAQGTTAHTTASIHFATPTPPEAVLLPTKFGSGSDPATDMVYSDF